MIKTLAVAAALTVSLAGYAAAQQSPPAAPAHHLSPHRRLPPSPPAPPPAPPSDAPSFSRYRSGADAVAARLGPYVRG